MMTRSPGHPGMGKHSVHWAEGPLPNQVETTAYETKEKISEFYKVDSVLPFLPSLREAGRPGPFLCLECPCSSYCSTQWDPALSVSVGKPLFGVQTLHNLRPATPYAHYLLIENTCNDHKFRSKIHPAEIKLSGYKNLNLFLFLICCVHVSLYLYL